MLSQVRDDFMFTKISSVKICILIAIKHSMTAELIRITVKCLGWNFSYLSKIPLIIADAV